MNTTIDRPWSHYFCCMLGANRKFVQRCPVTAKRALRAILKAADLCDSELLMVARFLHRLIAQGMDLRFLNELKKELKA